MDMILSHYLIRKDQKLKHLEILLRNIPALHSLPRRVLRTIILRLKMKKVRKGQIILNYGEIDPKTYFIHKGSVNVYVETNTHQIHFKKKDIIRYVTNKGKIEEESDEDSELDDEAQGRYLMQTIKEGGSFNFSNSYLNHYSLFTIEANENTVLMTLEKSEIEEIAKSEFKLYDQLSFLSAKYRFKGVKYDYVVPFNHRKDLTK